MEALILALFCITAALSVPAMRRHADRPMSATGKARK